MRGGADPSSLPAAREPQGALHHRHLAGWHCVASASQGETAAAPSLKSTSDLALPCAPSPRHNDIEEPLCSQGLPQGLQTGSELCTQVFLGGSDQAAPCSFLWMWVISGTRRCSELWHLVPCTTNSQ